MPIYDSEGNALFAIYDNEGEVLHSAYDAEGNLIFADSTTSLKVMEYNVGQWYDGTGVTVPAEKDEQYYALQNGMIQSADADLLFLCEYRTQFSATGRSAETMLAQYFPYVVYTQTTNTYMGRAIYSKYPISNYASYRYTSDRYYDTATVTVDNKEITVIVTHFSTNSDRYTEVTELISYLQTLDTFICAGDINTLSITNLVTTEASDYTNIIQPLLTAGFNLANCSNHGFLTTYSDVPTGTYYGCLDNVITSEDIHIYSARIDTTKLTDNLSERTDHMPLIVQLGISNEQDD